MTYQQWTMRELWELYRDYLVTPTGADEVRVQGIEQAFYGGAYALLLELLATSTDATTHHALADRIVELMAELEHFERSRGGTALVSLDDLRKPRRSPPHVSAVSGKH
jgi:hypothetical protein